jgi:hypothetical protein
MEIIKLKKALFMKS